MHKKKLSQKLRKRNTKNYLNKLILNSESGTHNSKSKMTNKTIMQRLHLNINPPQEKTQVNAVNKANTNAGAFIPPLTLVLPSILPNSPNAPGMGPSGVKMGV